MLLSDMQELIKLPFIVIELNKFNLLEIICMKPMMILMDKRGLKLLTEKIFLFVFLCILGDFRFVHKNTLMPYHAN